MTPYLPDSPIMFLWLHTIFYYNLAAQYCAKWTSCEYCTYLRGVSNASEYCAIVLKGELLGWPVSTAHCIVLNCIVLCCIETRVNIIDWTSELCVQCTPRHGVRRKPGMWLLTRGRGRGGGMERAILELWKANTTIVQQCKELCPRRVSEKETIHGTVDGGRGATPYLEEQELCGEKKYTCIPYL